MLEVTAGDERTRRAQLHVAPHERAQLYARLHLHLRVADALVHGQAATAPVEYTAWRSKAMPPQGWTPTATVPAALAGKAKAAFDAHTEIPWDRVGARLVVAGDGANTTLVRAGGRQSHRAGAVLTLRRLDVLHIESPTRLIGNDGLEIAVSGGEVVTLDRLAEHLAPAVRRDLEDLVERAATDPAAEARVEASLPWVHGILRDVAKQTAHRTAAKATLWLVTFDE